MSEQIRIGDSLLEYIQEIEQIQVQLREAASLAADCRTNIMDAETYQGKALETQQLFYCSLAENLQKMILLYQASATYLTNTYMSMYYNDEQLANYIADMLEGKS